MVPQNLKTLIIYKSFILAHFAIFVHDKVFTSLLRVPLIVMQNYTFCVTHFV